MPAIEKKSQNLQRKLWEKPAFEEINKRIYGTEIGSLKSKKQDSDSIEIRVWVGFDTSPLRSIILERDREQWNAYYLPPKDIAVDKDETVVRLSPPSSGWQKLWEELESLEINTLPDWTELNIDPKYLDITSVVIETKINNSHRSFMSFGFDKEEEQKYKQVQNVHKILKVLSKEFRVQLY